MSELPQSARIAIIGGGVIGLSIAYHLARLGITEVVVLERNQLTSGTSWHAAGIVGPLRASLNLTKLAIYATELFPALEAEADQSTGYRQTGGLWLAQTPDRLTEIARIAAMGEINGLGVRMLSPAETKAAMPLLETADLAGALWVDEDGSCDPVGVCMAFAKGARQRGVTIIEGAAVTGIDTANGAVRGVRLADGRRLACEIVVNAAGAWARQFGKLAGVPVPLQAVEHMYVVTEPVVGLPQPCPVMRDLDARIYIKEDAGKLVLGAVEADAVVWQPDQVGPDQGYLMFPEDWDHFTPFMEAGLNRLPVLAEVGIRQFMNGPESFTPDTRQLMGEAPGLSGFFVAAGMNTIGIMSAAGVGRVMAQWIRDGEAPMDLWPVDIARADPLWNDDGFLAARTPEAVAAQFEMHWPGRQHVTGRNLRMSAFHDMWAAEGAVFGVTGGWERPLWFASAPEEREMRYTYGAQSWWPAAEREARAMRDGVALIELTPFSKIAVEGPDAESFLQRVAAGNMAVEPGRLVYTQMLNTRGGIEADLTVRRVAETAYRVIGGAATRWRDLARLKKLVGEARVTISDCSEDEAVLGVMGPEAAELLRRAGSDGCDLGSMAFSTAARARIAGVPVTLQRLSYAGEYGFEIYVSRDDAARLHAALKAAGGNAHLGLNALDGCRLEKGFRHWGHDIGPDDTPLEAGLGFAVAFGKAQEFIGRTALERQKEKGVRRRLVLFEADAAVPLLLHDEPIYHDGERVGLTTSGGRGPRTGKMLCFGYVTTSTGAKLADLHRAPYEVAIAGHRFGLTALARPPYDPDGLRMRPAPLERKARP